MAVQANIQALNNTERGVIELTTSLTEKAVFQIAGLMDFAASELAGEMVNTTSRAVGAAMPIFNVISTVIRGVVDSVNAKYETTLNVFNNYEPYDLPFKSEEAEDVAEPVRQWFAARGASGSKPAVAVQAGKPAVQTKWMAVMKNIFTPERVIIAGCAVVLAGFVWFMVNRKKA